MGAVHIHLITNTVPAVGAFLGVIVLIYGMIRQSPPTLASAYIVFMVSAVFGLIAYFTGEGAEHTVENLPGVSHAIIEMHEEVALYTLIAYILLAIVSLIGFLKSKNHYDNIKVLAMVILVIAFISCGLATYTGFIGGQIRHTEVRSIDPQSVTSGEQNEH